MDYVSDFQTLVAKSAAKLRKSTAPVLHLLCQVTPQWVLETGSLHSPDNPRVVQLFSAAIKWAELLFGKESLLAARMDLDERGGGVVDVFVAPIATSKSGRRYYGATPLLKKLQKLRGHRHSFSALQDEFAEFCKAALDPRIQRGVEKDGIGPDRLTPEMYRAKIEIDQRTAELAQEAARLGEVRIAMEAERASFESEKRLQLQGLQEARDELAKFQAEARAQLERERSEMRAEIALELQSMRAAALAQAQRIVNAAKDLERRQRAAAETLMGAVQEARIVSIDEDGGAELDPGLSDPDQSEIRGALTAASATSIAVVRGYLKTSAKLKMQAEQFRLTAQHLGYQDGQARACRIVKDISATIRDAAQAYMRGDFMLRSVTNGEKMELEPIAVRDDEITHARVRAVKTLGLACVFEAIGDVHAKWRTSFSSSEGMSQDLRM